MYNKCSLNCSFSLYVSKVIHFKRQWFSILKKQDRVIMTGRLFQKVERWNLCGWIPTTHLVMGNPCQWLEWEWARDTNFPVRHSKISCRLWERKGFFIPKKRWFLSSFRRKAWTFYDWVGFLGVLSSGREWSQLLSLGPKDSKVKQGAPWSHCIE